VYICQCVGVDVWVATMPSNVQAAHHEHVVHSSVFIRFARTPLHRVFQKRLVVEPWVGPRFIALIKSKDISFEKMAGNGLS
jgi:hypothetical protein